MIDLKPKYFIRMSKYYYYHRNPGFDNNIVFNLIEFLIITNHKLTINLAINYLLLVWLDIYWILDIQGLCGLCQQITICISC